MRGTVEAIFITAAAGRPMTALTSVSAIAGVGLEGDRYATRQGYYSEKPSPGGGREVTLLEAEVLESLKSEHGIDLPAIEARRNLLTRGVRLHDLVGKRFRVGEVRCEGVRVCEPCVYLEGLTGKPVNAPLVHRGGLRANILAGGVIHTGDVVSLEVAE